MPSDYDRIRAEHVREYGEGTRHLAFLDRLYPDRTHFLFELLQNAEDARATWVRFELFADRLEVRHDGRPFDERDVRAICGVDSGSKAGDLTQIGRYGIGFKSVYAYTSSPEVHCGDEHFRIESYVRPHAATPRELNAGETLFVLPFTRAGIEPDRAVSEIAARLEQLEAQTLLFLRHIARVGWTIAGGASGEIARRQEPRGTARLVSLDRVDSAEKWLVFARSRELDSTDNSIRGASRWVEIAYRFEQNADHGERIVPVPNTRLVVFFPTEKETHLGFLVQGPFKTTPARDNVPGDDAWNRQLLQESAELAASTLPVLREMGLLSVEALSALPLRAADFPREAMFRPFFEAIRSTLQNEPLLPAQTGGYVSAGEARLAASGIIRELFSPDQLRLLYRAATPLHWISSKINETASPEVYAYLRFQLGVDEVGPESIAFRCDETFLAPQDDTWLTRFYAFLSNQPAVWGPAGGVWGSSAGPLRDRPFLRLENGEHIPPFRADGTPAAYLPPREETDYPIVRRVIAADPSAREFLIRLGLREPDIIAEVLERVLDRYASSNRSSLSPVEHDRNLEKIWRALAMATPDQKRTLLKRLERTPFLCARSAAGSEAAHRAPIDTYESRPELDLYFSGNENAWFVAETNAPDAESGGWTMLGVAIRPRRVPDDLALSMDEKRLLRGDRQGRWTGDIDATDYELDGLAHFLAHFEDVPELRAEKSLVLWQLLAEHADSWSFSRRQRAFQGEYRWAYHDEEQSAFFPAAFVRHLQTAAWLPARNGQFVEPARIALAELPDEYVREEALAAALGMGLGELDRFAREHGVSPDLLRFAVEYPEEVEELRRRHIDDEPEDDEGSPEEPLRAVDFASELEAAFAPDVVGFAVAPATASLGETVSLPEATAVGVRLQRLGEVDRARFARVPRRLWNQIEGRLRVFFLEQYDGHCQICAMTFRTRSGMPFWEGLYLVPAARARFPNRPGNVLVLCPMCCAKFLYGPVEAEDLRIQVDEQRESTTPVFRVRLCGEKTEISFSRDHFADLASILADSVLTS